MIPFTTEQFLNVFSSYNRAVFPAQIFHTLLAFVAVFLALKPYTFSGRAIAGILTFFWLWMGVAYHLAFFTEINGLAYLFGGLFIIQATIFLFFGVIRYDLSFRAGRNIGSNFGAILIAYALFIYPIINYFSGYHYPAVPTFGVPCPTTIFTFGMLLWTDRKVSILFLMIPLVWSLISISAVFSLGIHADLGLVFAGFLTSALLIWRD